MRGLLGKAVLLTGAAGGYGRALTRRFAEEGCHLGLVDRDADGLTAAVDEARSLGVEAHPFAVDISDYGEVEEAVATFHRAADRIDVLVNNAGWDRFALFLDTDPALWDQLIAVNLRGPLNLHHTVLPIMRETGGQIVNVASDAARVGSSLEAVYAACKAGIIAFTKTIAREHARDGVVANVVSPGPGDTPLFHGLKDAGPLGEKIHASLAKAIPLGRIADPEDLPGIVAFLASEDARYITGQVISVSGGLTMAG